MDVELKSILLKLVNEIENLKAHCIVQGEVLEQAKMGINRDVVQARIDLAKKPNAKTYSALRSKIEALK